MTSKIYWSIQNYIKLYKTHMLSLILTSLKKGMSHVSSFLYCLLKAMK